jgi:hypothetical protein
MRDRGATGRGSPSLSWLLGGALLLLAARPAAADLVVPGWKSVALEASIDFGPFAPHVSWLHVVREGDTLESLAKTLLGAPERKTDIALPDGTRPREPLTVGETLVMPPRPTTEKAPRGVAWWDAVYHDRISPPGRPERFFLGGPYPARGKDSYVYLVPHELWPSLAKAERHDAFLAEPRVLRTKSLNLHASARASDPTTTIVRRYRMTPGEGNLLELSVAEEKRFDAQGKLVAGTALARTWPLLATALVGLVGLAAVARRRRARVVAPA